VTVFIRKRSLSVRGSFRNKSRSLPISLELLQRKLQAVRDADTHGKGTPESKAAYTVSDNFSTVMGCEWQAGI